MIIFAPYGLTYFTGSYLLAVSQQVYGNTFRARALCIIIVIPCDISVESDLIRLVDIDDVASVNRMVFVPSAHDGITIDCIFRYDIFCFLTIHIAWTLSEFMRPSIGFRNLCGFYFLPVPAKVKRYASRAKAIYVLLILPADLSSYRNCSFRCMSQSNNKTFQDLAFHLITILSVSDHLPFRNNTVDISDIGGLPSAFLCNIYRLIAIRTEIQ